MKNSTKFKIIQWVTRILNFTQPIHPPIETSESKVHHLRVQQRHNLPQLPSENYCYLEEGVAYQISKELIESKIINISSEKIGDEVVMTANLFFVLPSKEVIKNCSN